MITSLIILSAQFPAHWQTYIVEEGRDFAASGLAVRHVSTRLPAAEHLSQDLMQRAGGGVPVLFPPDWRDVVALFTRPRRTAAMLRYLRQATAGGRRGRLRRLALLPSVAGLLRLAREAGADLVLVHSFGDAAHVAAMADRAGGLPYALTLHGDLHVWGGDIALKAAGAIRVFCVTRPLAEAFAQDCADVPVSVAPMGVDLRRFRYQPPRRTDPQAPFSIGTIARLHPGKGHRVVLEAMARLRAEGHDIRYRIAGTGEHGAEIAAQVARLGLEDRVALLGALSGDEVAALLHRLDATVLASRQEAAPVSVIESMVAGPPTVATRVGGVPAMIDDGVDGLLLPPEDPEALAAALRRLILEPPFAAQLSQQARARGERQFAMQARSAQVLGQLQADMAGRGRRHAAAEPRS